MLEKDFDNEPMSLSGLAILAVLSAASITTVVLAFVWVVRVVLS